LHTPLLSPYALHVPPISFSFLSPDQYLVRNTDHSAPHYVIFSIPRHLVPLSPKYSPQHSIFKHLSLRSALYVFDQVSHPYRTTGKITVLYIISFKFLFSKLEDKRFCAEL
jgi:hypothetical protein